MSSPAFQFYPKEWLSNADVTVMTPAEEGAYIRLLSYAWLDPQCSIPNDDTILARLSRLGDDWNKGGYSLVKAKFRVSDESPDRLVNDRLLQERQKQDEWRQKSIEGGKKGSAKRWGNGSSDKNKGGHQMVITTLLPKDDFAVCSLHLHNTPIVPTAEDIYQAYPRKVSKPHALKAITKAMSKQCPVCLLESTKRYADARDGEMQFTPHPATWFNGERYNDDPNTWIASPTPQAISRLEEAIAKHPANGESIYHDPQATPEQREDLKQKRMKLRDIREQLGQA